MQFLMEQQNLIKRIIAGSGDWVDIDSEGIVYVNGTQLEEPYVAEHSLGEVDTEFPYQVPESSYFVLGDKRESSID